MWLPVGMTGRWHTIVVFRKGPIVILSPETFMAASPEIGSGARKTLANTTQLIPV